MDAIAKWNGVMRNGITDDGLQFLSRATDQFMIETAPHLQTMEEILRYGKPNNARGAAISVLLTSGMTAPTLTKAARVAELRRRWATPLATCEQRRPPTFGTNDAGVVNAAAH